MNASHCRKKFTFYYRVVKKSFSCNNDEFLENIERNGFSQTFSLF